MPITPNGPAPYPPAGKVIEVLERHRKVGLPTPVTTEVVERVTGTPGLAPRIMRALRLFDLIDKDGNPTPQFEELAKAPSDADFKERFAGVLRAAYADIFQYVDPATASPERLEGQFRNYTPRGQVDRMVALFRGLCEFAGIIPEGSALNGEGSRARARPRQDRPRRTRTRPLTPKDEPDPPKPDPPVSDAREQYIRLLISKAEEEMSTDLLDRIERALGIAAKASAPDDEKGGEES